MFNFIVGLFNLCKVVSELLLFLLPLICQVIQFLTPLQTPRPVPGGSL